MKTELRKKFTRGVVVCLVLNFCIAFPSHAFSDGKEGACKGFDMPKNHPGGLFILWRDAALIKDIGLSDSQIKQLKETEFNSREKQIDLIAKAEKLDLEMERAFTEKLVNEKNILELARKIADTRGLIYINKIETKLAVGKILTYEQMCKLQSRQMRHQICDLPKSDRKPPLRDDRPDFSGEMKENP